MKCQSCNQAVNHTDKFCTHCGTVLAVSPEATSKAWQFKLTIMLLLFISVVGAIILIQNFYQISQLKMLNQVQPIPNERVAPPAAPTGFPGVAMIFSALNTPCGKCNDLLINNDCNHKNGGKESKARIEAMLASGKSVHDIVEAFVKDYGESILSPPALAIYRDKRKKTF